MATLYMMCGLSANGKTTFAKSFAKMNHIRYVNPDELYAVFNGDECNRSHKFEVWQEFWHKIESNPALLIFCVISSETVLSKALNQ